MNRMYLLDTNVISELRRPRPHGAVVAWLQSVADGDLDSTSRSPVMSYTNDWARQVDVTI